MRQILKIEQANFPLKDLEATVEHVRMAELMKLAVERIEAGESEYCRHDVEAIECHSRDGFIPHSHNHGGYSVRIYKTLCEVDPDEYQKSFEFHAEFVKEEHPEMDTDSDEFLELVDQSMSDGDNDKAILEARVMFNGVDEQGMYTAELSMIYRTTDAPYFRYADSYTDYEIEFRSALELESKLEVILKKLRV